MGGTERRRQPLYGRLTAGQCQFAREVSQVHPRRNYSGFPPGDFWTCDVGGWGLDTTDAPAHVLRAVVAQVGRHVDVLRLAGMPKRHRGALKATGSKVAATAVSLLDGDSGSVLEKLESVLAAIGRTPVISIEGLDRDAAGPHTVSQSAALLDRLRPLQHVTFVLSLDAGQDGAVDVLRLCDHVESLTPPDADAVSRLLTTFQARCLVGHPRRHRPGKPEAAVVLLWR